MERLYRAAKAATVEEAVLHDRRPRRYEPGRACSTCQKILSVWNRGPTCYACDQARLESYPDTPLIELLEEIP